MSLQPFLGRARRILIFVDLDPKAPHEIFQHPIEVISYDRSGGSESQVHTEGYLLLS